MNSAYKIAILLYGILIFFVVLFGAEKYNPDWFHGYGDERMAWTIGMGIAGSIVLVLDLVAIAFSRKYLTFIVLYGILLILCFANSFITEGAYSGKARVNIQCQNNSKYNVRDVALYSLQNDVIPIGRILSGHSEATDDYLPRDGRVVIYWSKGDESHVKRPLKLWNENKPPKEVRIILEENSAQVVGMPPSESRE